MKGNETIKTVKQVLSAATAVGVGTVVGNVVRHVTPVDIGLLKKVCVLVGSAVIGFMAEDKTTAYVDEKIDEVVEMVEKKIEERKESPIIEEELAEA